MERYNSCFKLMAFLLVPLTITAGMVGCSDKENVLNTDEFNKKLEVFNFKTSAPVTLSVDLGAEAAKEVVAIYPTEVDVVSAGMHTDMLYSAFTDSKGKLNTDVELPAAVTKVWIVSPTKPSLGVHTAEVQNGKLTISSNQSAQVRRSSSVDNTTTDTDGNIITTQDDGTSLTLFNITKYITVHEDPIPDEDKARFYSTISTVKKSEMGQFWCIDRWMPTKTLVDGEFETDYHYGKIGNENKLKSVNEFVKTNNGTLFTGLQDYVTAEKANFNVLDPNKINQIMDGETTVTNNADGSTTTQTYKGAELWVTILKEQAAYQNTFGYYIYKTGDVPTDVNKMDRFIIFPSVSINGLSPYDGSVQSKTNLTSSKTNISNQFGPLNVGDRIQLLFKDPETGTVSKIFPKGYTVGFWFCADAYDPGWNVVKNGSTYSTYGLNMDYESKIVFTQHSKRYQPWRLTRGSSRDKTNTYFCHSNNTFNNNSLVFKGSTDGNTYKTRYARYDGSIDSQKFIIYGIEDNTDASFTDIVFTVDRTDHYDVKNSHSDIDYHVEQFHTISTYAFEDQWPDGGDFDMNDVIIEHDQSQTYTQDNKIYTVSDKFTIVSKLDAAGYHNAFYVQIPEGQEGKTANLKVTVGGVEVPNRWESETNSIIVFNDQREAIISGETTVMVTRDLSESNLKVGDLKYNPYIISQAISSTGESQIGIGRMEIHIPGLDFNDITSLGYTIETDGSVNSNYYTSQFVSETGEFPFAISLAGKSGWFAPEPGIRVDLTFKKYTNWRAAGSSQDSDWYNNINGNDYRFATGKYNPNATPGVW